MNKSRRLIAQSSRLVILGLVAIAAALVLPASASTATTSTTDFPALPSDNLIKNPSFETSLTGWSSWQGRLSLVSGNAYGTRAARATLRSGSSFTLDDFPDSVTAAKAGEIFDATAHVRGVSGRSICLIVREWSGSTFVGSIQNCLTASSSWRSVGPTSYTVKKAGSTIDVYLAQSGARSGDWFEADGVVLRRRTSTPVAPIVVPPPSASALPTVTGTAQVGQTLTAAQGTWSGTPTSYAYQWQRCNSTGASCVAISGAATSSYVLVTGDQGTTLRVAVTAVNAGGSTTAASAQTAVVQAPPAPAPAPAPVPVPAPSPTGVTPPAAPQSYSVPANAVVVRNAAELASAVAAGSPRDIVLEDGVYTRSSSLTFGVGHRLWARNLGGATLRFGLVLGGTSGGGGQELHGLRIDVTDPALTLHGTAVYTWGPAGQNAAVYDSWLLGNRALTAGVRAHQVNGLKVQRVVVRGFTDWGIFFQTYYPAYLTDNPGVKPVITDADISSVHRPVRGASDGTSEAGLWAGVGCTCSRVKIRDTGWSGVETAGNVNGGVFEDLDIGDVHGVVPSGGPGVAGAKTGVGIYVEHYTRGTTFRRIHVHAGGGIKPKVGVHTEWADPGYTGTNPQSSFVGASFDVSFEDSTFDTSNDGIYLADATRTIIRRIKFVGQKYAGIRDFMTSRTGYSTTRTDNTFSMLSGAAEYTTVHSSSAPGYYS